MRAGKVQRLRAAFHTKSSEQAPEGNFDGMLTDIKFFRDFTVT